MEILFSHKTIYWEVIQRGNVQRGNVPVSVSTDTNGVIKVLPPKTAEEILARERERKARTTLLLALPEDHLTKFHKMTNAKEMRLHLRCKSEFLRSLPSAWSQVSLIMRTKPGVDSLSFDDLYNNLRVFESDVKGSTASSSSTQNVAFVFENTSSTNEVSTAYGASRSFGHNPQREGSSSYTDELMYLFFANQSSSLQLDHEDLEQLDEFDLEEMNLKWQVAMISIRLKKFYKKTDLRGIKIVGGEMLRTQGIKLKIMRGDLVNRRNLKLCNSGLDTEVTSCSKECKESYAKLKKIYDEQREQIGDANDKTDVLTYHKKLLAEAEKEKEELKAKVEKWHNSSKSLNILLNSQMSARDKAGLGYGDQMNKGVLSYENEVFGSLFYSRSSDIEDSPVNDRYAEGMHAVPPPMTGIYIPSGPDKEIDEFHRETVKSQFTHSKNPKVDKKGLGYGFATKACFVCGSLSHLIRDCDFHEKRMAKQVELNKQKGKGSSQREIRPVWNNVQKVNHKNQFVPTAVLTRTGKIPISTARASGTNNLVLLGEEGKLLLSPQQVVIGDQKDITGIKSPNTMVDQDLEIVLLLKIH
ncbi:hypothetical protein Tco_0318152 [Tanacetum coccineum]